MSKLVYSMANGWVAKWDGSLYITLSFAGQCVDLINVYDYRAGEIMIPFTMEALKAEVDEHMNETAEDRATFEEEALYRAVR